MAGELSYISKSPPYCKLFKLTMNILDASSEAVTHKHTSFSSWEGDSQDESYNFNVLDENIIVSVCDHISDMLSNSSLVEMPAHNISIEQDQSNNNDLKESSSITNMNVQMSPELNDFREKHPKRFIFAHLNINWFHSKFIEIHKIVTLNLVDMLILRERKLHSEIFMNFNVVSIQMTDLVSLSPQQVGDLWQMFCHLYHIEKGTILPIIKTELKPLCLK